MERTVDLGLGARGVVSVRQPLLRFAGNPVLTAQAVNQVWTSPGLQVVTAHNAGAAVVGDETVLLFRSHLRCGISVLGLARSTDGLTNWRVDPRPVLVPAARADRYGPGVEPEDQVALLRTTYENGDEEQRRPEDPQRHEGERNQGTHRRDSFFAVGS